MRSDYREKGRAVFLAALMVLSVMTVGGFAFAGNAAAATTTVSSGDSIQTAINNAEPGDTISVESGTYNEEITIKKSLTLVGAGDSAGGTVLEGSGSGSGITVNASDVIVRDIRVTNYSNGLQLTGTNSNITLERVQSVDNDARGIAIRNDADLQDLELNQVNSSNNAGDGLRAATSSSIDGLTVQNSHFDGNSGNPASSGFEVYQSEANPGELTNVSITDTTFNNNGEKGIYVEKLSNALFDNITVDGVQSDTYGYNTGVDINLKYGDYQNITIQNSEIANVSEGDPSDPSFSAAIAIKARDDGGYSDTPASVNDVTLDNVIVEDSFNGLRFGEVGVDYSGSYSGPTNVVIKDSTFQNNDRYHIEDVSGSLDLATVEADNTFDRIVSSEAGIYSSIQSAVDTAEDGDTVTVGPGTYEESLDISTNNLTILGAGSDEVTIDVTNAGDVRGINAKADNLTLSGFTLVGPGGDGKQGIHTGSPPYENLHINDVVVKDFDRNGIDVHGVDGVMLTNVEAHNNAGVGIALTDSSNITVSRASATNNSWGGLALWSNGGYVNDGVGIHNAVIMNSTFENNPGAGIYMEDSAGIGPDGFEDIVVFNSEIESNGAGFMAFSGTNASGVFLYQNSIVDNDGDALYVDEGAHGVLNAPLNWWGSESGPAANNINGSAQTNPFLTVSPAEAADDPSNLTEFAYTVEMDAGAHAFGVPGPVEGTVGSVFNDFNGTVYAYEDGSWTQVTDSDRKLGALDALLVIPEEGETARAAIEIAEGSGEGVPPAKELDEGWNFVGAPQEGNIEIAYGASSADPARALNLYDAPTLEGGSTDGSWTKHTFGSGTTDSVSPYSGYWVYAEENGSVAGNVPSGVTVEEYNQLVSSETLIKDS